MNTSTNNLWVKFFFYGDIYFSKFLSEGIVGRPMRLNRGLPKSSEGNIDVVDLDIETTKVKVQAKKIITPDGLELIEIWPQAVASLDNGLVKRIRRKKFANAFAHGKCADATFTFPLKLALKVRWADFDILIDKN
jgi:hypothetical protein